MTSFTISFFVGKEKAQTEMEALQKQAEGVSKEYDRLLAEHSKLQVTYREESCM